MILYNIRQNKAKGLILFFAALLCLLSSKIYAQPLKKKEFKKYNNYINADLGIATYNQFVLIFSPYIKIGYGRRVIKQTNLFLNVSATFVHPNNYPKGFNLITTGNTIFNDQAYIAPLIGLTPDEVTAKKIKYTSCPTSLVGITINYEFVMGKRKRFSLSPIFGANWVSFFATDTRLYNERYVGGKLKSAEFNYTFNQDAYFQVPFGIRFTEALKNKQHQFYLEITGNVNGDRQSVIGSGYEATHMGLGYKYCF